MLYIFDLDGTLTNTPFIDKMPRALLPGRKEKIAALQAAGHVCAIATNQGGVAFGFTTEEAATEEVAAIARELNIELFEVAFGHPKPKWGYEQYGTPEHLARRKPEPGMFHALIERAAGAATDGIHAIGDRDEDQQAAAKVEKCLFHWAADFFGKPEEQLWKVYQLFQRAEALQQEGLQLILSPNGKGSIGWRDYSDWLEWSSLENAPGLIEAAIKQEEERREELKKQAAITPPDDFDPFLNPDDLP